MIKRIAFIFLILSAFALQGCHKEEKATTLQEEITDRPQPSKKVSITVGYEPVIDAASGTKISINETIDNFYFDWSGNEHLMLTTSTATASSDFELSDMDSHGHAIFSGTLPSAGSVSSTNYIAVNKDVFVSSGGNLVGEIKSKQDHDPINSGMYALMVSRSDNTTPGTLDQPIYFKTMNSFFKFSFTKGSPAAGATHTYSKMYLRGVVLEALGGEAIAGKFGISKVSDDYYNAYTSTTESSSTITLNCMTTTYPKGVELGPDALDFYFSVAFGTYASGFKVTMYVANESGEEGVMTKKIASASGKTLERNKMYTTPALAISPKDVVYNYALISDLSDITEGHYYLAGYLGTGNLYEVWKGTLSSGKDMVTSQYTYNTTTDQITGGTGADLITLVKNSDGKFIVKTSGNKYLYVANYGSNRSLALTDNESEAHEVTFDYCSKGGFDMKIKSGSATSYLRTNNSASSNPVRNYQSSSTGSYGIVLFKKVGGYAPDGTSSGGGGGDSGGGTDPSTYEYGYLELPSLPASMGNNKFYTIRASGVRNYSALYSPDYYSQMWTAYPLHSSHTGSLTRPSSWNANPFISTSLQTNLSKSYGSYSRGHQIPNGDRNGIKEMQLQTFYWTNSVPQIQNGFNGAIWGRLEDAVRSILSSYSDTLYVVTGPVYQTVGGSETIDYTINKNDGKSIAVPNYFYKIVLKVKRNSGGQITDALSVGFWFEHKDYGTTSKDYETYAKSTSDIEALTGFNFFANLPSSVVTTAKSNTSWSAFKSFK